VPHSTCYHYFTVQSKPAGRILWPGPKLTKDCASLLGVIRYCLCGCSVGFTTSAKSERTKFLLVPGISTSFRSALRMRHAKGSIARLNKRHDSGVKRIICYTGGAPNVMLIGCFS
jgi:hypothetical protein